jgi:hypothetical protein
VADERDFLEGLREEDERDRPMPDHLREALEACVSALLTGIDYCDGPMEAHLEARTKMHEARGKALAALDALAASSTPAPTETRRFEYQAVHEDGRSHPISHYHVGRDLLMPGWRAQRAELFRGPWVDVPAEGEREPALEALNAEVAPCRAEILGLVEGFDWGMGALREQMEGRGYRPIVVSIALNGLMGDGGPLTADHDLVVRRVPAEGDEG